MAIILASVGGHVLPTKPGTSLEMSLSRRHNLSNPDKKRVEPLVSLICYYLTQDRASRGRLRAKIREGWPTDKRIGGLWPPTKKLQAQYVDRLIEYPIQHRHPDKTEFMIELVVEHGRYLIGSLPESDQGNDPHALATMFYDALMEEDAKPHAGTGAVRSADGLHHIRLAQMNKP